MNVERITEFEATICNEPLALVSDERSNDVTAFACWRFSVLFYIVFTLFTYRRSVPFAASSPFEGPKKIVRENEKMLY